MKRITVAEAQASHPTINPETYINDARFNEGDHGA